MIQTADADVADGEFIVMVALLGGKSTLPRHGGGSERVTSGDIWIDRKRVTEMETERSRHRDGVQNYALYPHMSVEENMGVGLKNSRFG